MRVDDNLLGRFEGEPWQQKILKEHYSKFISILRTYYNGPHTIDGVTTALNDDESPESLALQKLVAIYASAEQLTKRWTSAVREDENVPIFSEICLPTSAESLEEYLEHAFRGKRVLIKPNLVSTEVYPETSSLDTISKVLGIVSGQTRDVCIGDGPSLFFDARRAIGRIQKAFPEIEVINFNESDHTSCLKLSWEVLVEVEIPSEVYGFDCIVNLCNFKEHNSFLYSGSKKNMMGMISPATRLVLHRLKPDLREKAIEELSDLFKPQVVVMDARKVMVKAQQKRYGGCVVDGPGIFYARDPSLIDNMMIDHLKGGC